MPTAIMIVANDKAASAAMAAQFSKREFSVLTVHSGRQALLQSKTRKPEAIIVDGASPRLNARRLCRALRSDTRALIIGLAPSMTRAEQFKSAHVILPRSITARKLIQRLRAELEHRPAQQVRVGSLTLDLQKRRVIRGSKQVRLTPKEFELLRLLMDHADQVVSRELIMREIWDTDFMGDTRTLDVHVRWLREKIEDNASKPTRLLTVRGEGYRLESKSKE